MTARVPADVSKSCHLKPNASLSRTSITTASDLHFGGVCHALGAGQNVDGNERYYEVVALVFEAEGQMSGRGTNHNFGFERSTQLLGDPKMRLN